MELAIKILMWVVAYGVVGWVVATARLYGIDRRRDWQGRYNADDLGDAALSGLIWPALPLIAIAYYLRPNKIALLLSKKSRKLAEAERAMDERKAQEKLGSKRVIAMDNLGGTWEVNEETGFARRLGGANLRNGLTSPLLGSP